MCSPKPGNTSLALLLAVALLFFACKSDEEKLADFLSRGEAALEAEEHAEAIIEYRNVLQIDPNHAEAHYALAKSYTALQKLKEAYWELHESVRLDSTNIEARLSFAQFSLIARDYEEVLTQVDAILEAEPDRATAYTLRGEALGALERFDEASQAFEAAVEVAGEEKLGRHLMNLVQYQSRRGNDAAARPHLARLIEVDPGFRSYTTLGRFLVRTRAPKEDSKAAFLTALELADADTKSAAYRNLAGFYFNRKNTDLAVSTLEEGIESVEEGRLDLIYLLARFHRSVGNEEAADELVERATLDVSDDPAPFLVLSSYRSRKGDNEGALEAVEKALEIEPDNKQARLRKAELLVDSGYRGRNDEQIKQGRSIVETILENQPSNPEALFVRAKIEMAELDPKSAATSLRSALDVRPDWAQARFVLGSALMLLGDQNGARAELARAVELDAGLVEARRALARIHAALGEHEYAIEQGRIYLRERPDDARTQILVAQSLVALGKADEAYDEILKLPEDQREGDAWYALGRLEMARGNADEARAALLKANEDRPNHADILRSLYRVELLTGDTELAAERVRKAVAEDPTDAGLAQLEGEVAMSAKDMVAAEAAFKRAVELRPDEATAYQRLAAFYRVTGRLDDAISTYQNSLAENPNSARLHERLAILYEFRGDEADAIRAYEEAIDLDSTLGESKNNLAYLLAESGGDLDRALDLAQEAKALLPDNPNTADTLGWVLFKRGIPSAAIGYLREAAASFQEDPRALAVVQHHLASAYEANSQPDEALKAINSALKSIDERAAQVRAEGGEVVEPAWTAEARQMAKRLRGAS